MTDPISIVGLVASVVQLVDTASKVADYLSDVKHASEEQQQLLDEIAHLGPLLDELKRLDKQGQMHLSDPGDPRIVGMEHLKTALAECRKRLEALKKGVGT